ncbi:MAG: hypothetical protein AB7P49_00155 [Bdellovibrionales bacterium]
MDGNEQPVILAGKKRTRRVVLEEEDDGIEEIDTGMEVEQGVVIPTSVNGRDVISTPALPKDVFAEGSIAIEAEAAEITTSTVVGISPSTPSPPQSEMNDVAVSSEDYTEMVKAKITFQIREPFSGTTSSATLRAGAAFSTFFSPGLVYEGEVVRTSANGARYYEPSTDRPLHIGRQMQNLLKSLAAGVRMFYHYPAVVVQRVSEKGKPVGKGVQLSVLNVQQLEESLTANGMASPAFAFQVRSEPDELRNTSRVVQRMAPLRNENDLQAVFRDTASNFGLRNPVIFVHESDSGRETMRVPTKALRVYSETDLANAEDALVGGLIDDSNPASRGKTEKAVKRVRLMKEQVVSSPVVAAQRGLDVSSGIQQVIMDTRIALQNVAVQGGPEARALQNVIDSLTKIVDAILAERAATSMDVEDEESRAAQREQARLRENIELLRYRRVMAEKRMKSKTSAPTMAEMRKAVLNELRESLSPGARAVFVFPEEIVAAVSRLRLNWSAVKLEAETRLTAVLQRAGPSPTPKEAEEERMFEMVLSSIRVGEAEKSDDTILKGVYSAVRKRPDLFTAMSPTIATAEVNRVVVKFFDDESAQEYLPKDRSVKNTTSAVKDAALLALAFSEDVDDSEMAEMDAKNEAAEATQATVSRTRTKSVRSIMTGRSTTIDGRVARNQGVPVTFMAFGAYEGPQEDDMEIDDGVPQTKSFQFPMQKDVKWENIVDANGTQMFREGSLFYPAVLEEAVGSAEPGAPSSWQMSSTPVLKALRPVNKPLASVQEVQAALLPGKTGEAETAAFFVSSPFIFHKMEASAGPDGRSSTGSSTAYYAIQYSDLYEFNEIMGPRRSARWQLFWYNPRSKQNEDFTAYGMDIVWKGYYPLVSQHDFLLWRSVVGTAVLKVVLIPPRLQTRDEKKMMELAKKAANDEEEDEKKMMELAKKAANDEEEKEKEESPPPIF